MSDFSRRKFLKTTATISAAAVLADKSVNYAYAAGSDVVKVGVVGCGGRGTGAARDIAAADPAVSIVALGDLFPDRLEACRKNLTGDGGKNPGIGSQLAVKDDTCFTGFDNYKQVIASDIDIVMLVTPPGFRPMHFKHAIEAGKHVFFEKPVAVDPVGVRSVIETAELAAKKNLGVMAGTVFRHNTNHCEIIRMIHEGAIGDIVAGTSYYNGNGLWMHPRKEKWSDVEWQIRNWPYFTWLSGDHLVEQAVHRIDIQNWVMRANPISAYGMGGRQVRTDPAYGHIYDHHAVEYEYPGGVRVSHMCRQNDGTDTRITEYYVGTKGIAQPSEGKIGDREFFLGDSARPGKGTQIEVEPLNKGYIREHKVLIDSIRAGKPVNEGRQCAESTLTAIMGRMTAYTGKTVTWEHAMNSKLNLWPEKLEFGEMPVPPVAMPGRDPLI
jgi:predicted dehydrogenase